MPLGQTPNRRPLLALPLVALAALCVHPVVAQSDDTCLPEEFSVTNALYFPFDPDVVLNFQWFSLDAERERVDTFPSDTEYVGFIDAYDLGFRYALLGTHENQQVVSIDTCFLQALPSPVQETICFAEGASRRGSLSVGYAPLNRHTLEDTGTGQSPTEVDVLSAEIGSISVPVRVIERVPGRPLFLLELWDFRFEVDVAELAIPAACDGVAPPAAAATGPGAPGLGGESSESGRALAGRLPTARRLLDTAHRRGGR
ncbi:MAG: hypothetical protein AAFX50_22405 [Acidobacteriota bacterium]